MNIKIISLVFITLFFSPNSNAMDMYTGANFSMLDINGNIFGGTNDVSWVFDEDMINTSVNGTAFNGDIVSSWPFFGFTWSTHEVRVFGEGTYTFDTTCTSGQIRSGISDCNNSLQPSQTEQYITIEVEPGQLGVHMLWDWNTWTDTDIAIVWDRDSMWADADGQGNLVNDLWLGPAGDSPDPLMTWQLVSTDANDDGINGNPMVDGGLLGFYANFNFNRLASIPVVIDIKPRKKPENVISLRKDRNLDVAIVGDEEFDALQVDPVSVKFGTNEASPVRFKGKDYDRDGFSDLILTFKLNETGIACGDTEATLNGETYGGGTIEGSDNFTVKPCP